MTPSVTPVPCSHINSSNKLKVLHSIYHEIDLLKKKHESERIELQKTLNERMKNQVDDQQIKHHA